MDFAELVKNYGWYVALAIMILDRVFPKVWTFFTDKFFPSRARERAERREEIERAAQAQRDAESTILKAKIEREIREEEHRRKMDERIASAIENMAGALAINNERLAQLINITSDLSQFTNSAVGDMRVTVEKMHKRESHPKISRKKGTSGSVPVESVQMTRKMKLAIFLAYLPTLLLGLAIVFLVVMYLNGWRIWVVSPEIPTRPPSLSTRS